MIEAMRRGVIDRTVREIACSPGLEWVPLAVGWVLIWLQWLRHMVAPLTQNMAKEMAV
jgi:hypothetical protein